MIKVKKTDSIVDIIIKMKDEKEKKIIIDFPFWHPILHNYTSLKILKTKAGNKELIISTNDITSKKIWKKLWIKYSLISNPDIVWNNYSFWEYFIYTIKSFFKNISENTFTKSENSPFAKYHKLYSDWKISYFIWFLIISILLLFSVFYFAVNKTYVYIKPEIDVKFRNKNFIFKEKPEESAFNWENIIKLKKIEETVHLSDTFWTTWIKTENIINAKWKVIIYNLFPEKTSLMKNTRLQTETWVVFLIWEEIDIPEAKTINWEIIPWKKEIKVNARVKDANWKIIWKRWNIKAKTKLFLPWLKENKDKIYAIAKTNFSGWSDDYKKILEEDDIKNAKEMLRTRIEKLWLKKLKEKLKEENKINSVNYEILGTNNIIKYSDFEVSWIDSLKVWEERKNFKLFWTIKAKTYIYNKELLLNKLKNSIKTNVLEEVEEISSINEKSLAIALELNRSENPLEIKATVQIETFYIQNFLSKENSYVERLKNQIIWKDKQTAEKILINNPKISNASIKIRPFFINKVSNLTENIEFKILEK